MLRLTVAFLLSLVMSLGWGYFSFCYFREKKTCVKSKFLPDRKTLDETKKSVGIYTLVSALGLVLCFVFVKENIALAVCLCAFVMCLTAVGFVDDWLTDIKGQNVGLTPKQRIFCVAIISLLFGIILGIAKQNTIVTLPFVRGGVRLGWAYPLYICAVTLIFAEGSRCLGQTKGSDYPMTFVTLIGIAALCAVSGNNDITFVAIFLGLVAGLIWWTYPPCLVKTALGDKFSCCGLIISACVLTSNESFLWFAMCFEIIALISKPVDKFFTKIFHKHIFVKLPLSEHLTALGATNTKIYLGFTLIKFVFCIIGVASVCFVNLVN